MSVSDRYFDMLEQIRTALALHQYQTVLKLSYDSLPLVPSFISESIRDYGHFEIRSIPCIEMAARFSSAQGDVERLEQLRSWAESVPELAPWLVVIGERIMGAQAQRQILRLLQAEPGQLQSALPKRLGVSGKVIGRLVVDMEHLGILVRVPANRSYALYLPGAEPDRDGTRTVSKRRPRARVEVDPTDTWIAIDFETATANRNSACALGVAVLQAGAIVSSGAWLIQPPGNRYDSRNIGIHGISSSTTKHSPTYEELYGAIEPFLQDRYVLAHWADFDISVLRAVHELYRIPLPALRYACSCRMAQSAFPRLRNHQLPTVCSHCGIPLQHHHATSDALACAHVALKCRDAVAAGTIHDAVKVLGVRLARL